MKHISNSFLTAGAMLASFLVLGIHDYFAQEGSHVSTFLLLGFFLLLLVGVLFQRGEGGAPPSPRRGLALDILQRVAPSLVCAACGVLFFFPQWHSPVRLLVLCCAAGLVVVATGFTGREAARGAAAAAGCLLITLIATPQYYQGLPMFPVRSLALKVTVVSSMAALALCAALKLQGRVLLLAAIASGTALRIIASGQWEINGYLRDMLPLIESSLDSVLQGRDPYRLYFLTHDVPLTYLPVMWLTYFPSWLMLIDIRWTNIFLSALGCLLMYRWGSPPSGARPSTTRGLLKGLLPADTAAPLLMAVMIFSFQPEIFWNSVHAEPPVYWFWIIALLSCVTMRLYLPASILLGIVIATRHFGILFVPFYLLWIRMSGFSWRDVLAHALVTGGAAVAMILPWMMLNPDTFLYGTLEWLITYGKAWQPAWVYQIGFQSWFYAAGKERWLPVIQAASFSVIFILTAAAAVLARRRGRGDAAYRIAWIGCGLAYLIFLLFGSMIWKSFLVSVFFFPLIGFVSRAASPAPPLLPGRGAMKAVLVVILAAINLAGAIFAGHALKGWKERGDIIAFGKQVVAPRIKPGDLLIDYSLLNAWHVFQGSALSSIQPLPGVAVTGLPRSLEMARYRRIVLFDGYSRVDPEKDFPDIAAGFHLELKEKKGRSSLYIYRASSPYAETWRLSSNPGALLEAEFESPHPPIMRGKKYGDKFVFPGLDPWVWVGPAECLTVGVQVRSIFAQLIRGKTLTTTFSQPVGGESWLFTMLDDRALTRPLGPIEISVKAGAHQRTLLLPAVRGIFSWRIGKLPAGEVVMTVKGGGRASLIFFFDWAVAR